MTIRVLAVANEDLHTEMLQKLSSNGTSCELVGWGASHALAGRWTAELKPDIVLIDTNLPNLDARSTIRRILGQKPDVRIIALSARSDHKEVIALLAAGAQACLTNQPLADDLHDAIATVLDNRIYISPRLQNASETQAACPPASNETSTSSGLSPREQQVLKLLADGFTSKQIGEVLFISEKTVESHRGNIMTKLDIHTIAELTKYALRHKLTSLNF